MSLPARAKQSPAKKRGDLQREVFTISRELEYFTVDELIKQTGYGREEWWPQVIAKETIDNALDASEMAGVAPEITVLYDGDRLEIRDNGAGIPPETVERLVDYSTRTSDKLAYVSPTRGAQGNALKTILAMGYVLDRKIGNADAVGVTTIETQGVKHQIEFRVDHINNQPKIIHSTAASSVKVGTRLTISWPNVQVSNPYGYSESVGLL